jgi:Protein of unknown function (DUF2909)
MSAIIVVLLVGVVVSLGHALVSMSSGATRSLSVVRALTVRITLSVALFGFLMVGHYLGWIQPH